MSRFSLSKQSDGPGDRWLLKRTHHQLTVKQHISVHHGQHCDGQTCPNHFAKRRQIFGFVPWRELWHLVSVPQLSEPVTDIAKLKHSDITVMQCRPWHALTQGQ